jgi:hypothetical protein
MVFDEGHGLSTEQPYDPAPIINELRLRVNRWRLPNPSDWR